MGHFPELRIYLGQSPRRTPFRPVVQFRRPLQKGARQIAPPPAHTFAEQWSRAPRPHPVEQRGLERKGRFEEPGAGTNRVA